ncbi:Release factor glutamine methyltransferase [Nymphaea thermarum]|nr:Release factor glutamine methyltransferase [Nymphaea thermarum]
MNDALLCGPYHHHHHGTTTVESVSAHHHRENSEFLSSSALWSTPQPSQTCRSGVRGPEISPFPWVRSLPSPTTAPTLTLSAERSNGSWRMPTRATTRGSGRRLPPTAAAPASGIGPIWASFTACGRKGWSRPFQYVVGWEHWGDIILSVEEEVLIPRPETVQVVELVDQLCSADQRFREGLWADLGTGSGAIAIGVGRILRGRGRVVAVDLSDVAVAVASYNLERYGLQSQSCAEENHVQLWEQHHLKNIMAVVEAHQECMEETMELMNRKLQAVEHQNLKAEMKMQAFVADHSSLAVTMREMLQQGWGIGLTSTVRMKTATGPFCWIFKAKKFFNRHCIIRKQHVRHAAVHFEGATIQWYRWLVTQQGRMSWEGLIDTMKAQFGPSAYLDYNVDLTKIR